MFSNGKRCIFVIEIPIMTMIEKKQILLLWTALLAHTASFSQEKVVILEPSKKTIQTEACGTTIENMVPPSVHDTATDVLPKLSADSLHLPLLDEMGRVRNTTFYPRYYGFGWNNWQLHKGINISLGASVFTQVGSHRTGGVGFAQNLSAMYAMTLSPKLSLAVGGFFNNVSWTHTTFRDAGFNAVLGYHFDEHWEGYLYAQKAVTSNMRIPLYIQDLNDMGDRIGAAIRYNFNPSFSIQVSVEGQRFNR